MANMLISEVLPEVIRLVVVVISVLYQRLGSSLFSLQTFSKNTQETITPLDPDMRYLLHQQDFKVFYMLQEIQSVYRMQGEI
ncbi:hypothetical protein DPMN_048206 [Dreissena polymorpha]|uniref:Uncharacterized protein n=1 Tax=Dreissena polymorpha TaxID=45954 RepID=A0A9D4D953_DREPO|nr:hypothetical protein DPMN_048206 [Dreissena polymorpha]